MPDFRKFREQGWMFRMTEWFDGFQCCAFHRSHPHKYGIVSPWRKTEAQAWEDVAAGIPEIELKMQKDAEERSHGPHV